MTLVGSPLSSARRTFICKTWDSTLEVFFKEFELLINDVVIFGKKNESEQRFECSMVSNIVGPRRYAGQCKDMVAILKTCHFVSLIRVLWLEVEDQRRNAEKTRTVVT